MTQQLKAAVFLARAWWEDGQFRARIRYQVDMDADLAAETQILTADPAEVSRHLELWLEASSTAASQ